jgi:hypothetical protein
MAASPRRTTHPARRKFDEPGKIGKRSGQPIDLVDDHDADPAGLEIGEQVLQRGSLQIAAGEPAIIKVGSWR